MEFTGNRIGRGRVIEALLRIALVATFVGLAVGVTARPNVSASLIQDPIELAVPAEQVAPGADYSGFTIANGDPNEEIGPEWPVRGGGGILPAPEPAPRLDLSKVPGFTQHGLLKLGETDRMSGAFPADFEAYEVGVGVSAGGGVVDEELVAIALRGMSGETDAAAE